MPVIRTTFSGRGWSPKPRPRTWSLPFILYDFLDLLVTMPVWLKVRNEKEKWTSVFSWVLTVTTSCNKSHFIYVQVIWPFKAFVLNEEETSQRDTECKSRNLPSISMDTVLGHLPMRRPWYLQISGVSPCSPVILFFLFFVQWEKLEGQAELLLYSWQLPHFRVSNGTWQLEITSFRCLSELS